MAKIDYAVGDLVVCVGYTAEEDVLVTGWEPVTGNVYTVHSIELCENRLFVDLVEDPFKHPDYAWFAQDFRKLPKKSQEFFAGETQTVRDLVPAT